MPTPPDPAARDREAYTKWLTGPFHVGESEPFGIRAFRAGAAHGREEAATEIARLNRDLGIYRVEHAEYCREAQENSALRRTNSEQAALVKALEAERDEACYAPQNSQSRVVGTSARQPAGLVDPAGTYTPAPHAELRDEVLRLVDEYVADDSPDDPPEAYTEYDSGWSDDYMRLMRAVLALRAATAESEPVRVAAERLRIHGRMTGWTMWTSAEAADLRTVLDALDSALARKGAKP